MALQAAGRRSLVDAALDQLRAELARGAWPVGTRIPTEHALAEQLRVGRNTVREAVRVLVHAGMLESRQGDGTYVRAATDPADIVRRVERAGLRDIFEVRRAVEVEAARLAAARRDDEDLARLRAALAATAGPDGHGRHAALPPEEFDRFVEADLAIHLGVAEAAHNAALLETYRWFLDRMRASVRAGFGDAELPESSHADHVRLVDAIEARDPDAAEQAVRDILLPVVAALDALLGRDDGTSTERHRP